MIRGNRVLGGLVTLSLLSACTGEIDCGVADSVLEIKQVEIDRTRYYLYLKTSGVSDKATFLVLYDQQPSFDACGRADRDPMGEAYVEADQGAPVRAVFAHKALEVQYAQSTGESAGLQNIEVVVQADD